MTSRYTIENLLDWAYGGVDPSLPGNGGADCANFSSLQRRLFETAAIIAVSLGYIYWGCMRIHIPDKSTYIRKDRGGKRVLLVMMSLMFGMEIGFKFATKSLVYLLNPCHLCTAMQIYLLAAPPSKVVTVLFRIHLNLLNGAVLALLFPVTNTRLLPFEIEIYWIQHTMMLVAPYYLLRLGGVYTIERLLDLSWSSLSLGIFFIYHFVVLQGFGLATQVNLNNMLCPAISDPFYGPNYRMAALVHQSLLVPLACKSFCFFSCFFLTKFSLTRVKSHLAEDVTLAAYEEDVTNIVLGISNIASKGNDNFYHRRTKSEHRMASEGFLQNGKHLHPE